MIRRILTVPLVCRRMFGVLGTRQQCEPFPAAVQRAVIMEPDRTFFQVGSRGTRALPH